MKHTMKKLLCMALAIMLLVSAVPVFAMAAPSDVQPNVSAKMVSSAGTTVLREESRMWLDSTQSVRSVLSGLTTYDDTRYTVTYKWNGSSYTAAELDNTLGACDSLEFTLTKRSVPVTVVLDGVGSAQKNYEVDAPLTLNTNLLNSFGLQLTTGKEVDRWTANGGQESVSSYTITPADADRGYVTLTCYQKATATPPVTPPAGNVTLTVNYTGDRSGTVTLTVPANTAVTTNDVANAIKQQLGVSTLTVSGFPGTTVTGDTTVNGVTVSGINAVNPTLTIKVSGDYTGTASKTVPAGTSVTEADIKAAIKNDLGITSDFNIDVNGTPFTMPANNTTVFATATKVTSNSGTTTNKFPYDVYLNIYKDTLVGSADKSVKITNGIALDGLVTLAEVKTVVKNYYTAKDSDGISYDGLYLAQGNWVADYVADTKKYDSIDAGEMRQTGTVYINVMIGNAKAKSSSTADSSNPKTGDTIFVPVMVMGVTATALAAAYVFGKKRIAR